MRCGVCHHGQMLVDEYLVWQPFGPSLPNSELRKAFYEPGKHWKQYPQVKTCISCVRKIQQGTQDVHFRHKGREYVLRGNAAPQILQKR